MHSGFENLQKSPCNFLDDVTFCFDEQNYQVKSNSPPLLQELSRYFCGYEASSKKETSIQNNKVCVYLWDSEIYNNDIAWQNWQGEVGKTRLKEQYLDVADGRWIHKFKTGIVMFQHQSAPMAIGPCSQHLSQTINFIINQHINFLQQNDGLICHAACLQIGSKGVAIAAHSGGGKSTTMLKLMDLPDSRFVSNDRLFLFNNDDNSGIDTDTDKGTVAKGVPKQPRVNPGTLLHNTRLTHVLPPDRQKALRQLPTNELWQQEEKYDVMVADVYGADKIQHHTDLHHVILLNWQPGNSAPVEVKQISLDEKPELIAAIAKSPGSFYQNNAGAFLVSAEIPADRLYQDALRHVAIWEVTGGADFEQLITILQSQLSL